MKIPPSKWIQSTILGIPWAVGYFMVSLGISRMPLRDDSCAMRWFMFPWWIHLGPRMFWRSPVIPAWMRSKQLSSARPCRFTLTREGARTGMGKGSQGQPGWLVTGVNWDNRWASAHWRSPKHPDQISSSLWDACLDSMASGWQWSLVTLYTAVCVNLVRLCTMYPSCSKYNG